MGATWTACSYSVAPVLLLFSIFGAVRTGSYMMHILMTKGLQHSVCDQSFYNGPVSKFWAYAFVPSKTPELGGFSSLLSPLSSSLSCCSVIPLLGSPFSSLLTHCSQNPLSSSYSSVSSPSLTSSRSFSLALTFSSSSSSLSSPPPNFSFSSPPICKHPPMHLTADRPHTCKHTAQLCPGLSVCLQTLCDCLSVLLQPHGDAWHFGLFMRACVLLPHCYHSAARYCFYDETPARCCCLHARGCCSHWSKAHAQRTPAEYSVHNVYFNYTTISILHVSYFHLAFSLSCKFSF